MTPFNLGPLALTATYTTNIMNPATITGGVNGGSGALFILLTHIRVVNKTGANASFRLFRGATGANAAGTEVVGFDQEVEANKSYDWYGPGMLFKSTDFLVGGASAGSTLTIQAEGEIGVEL